MSYQLLCGDALTVLRTLPACSVQTCITSPPYFGLRAYLPDGHPDKALEIGTEQTPDEFVAALVAVFREVRRVLRDDGTCWINIGDSYCGYHGNKNAAYDDAPSNKPGYFENMRSSNVGIGDLKNKDLIGIPWMVAFALRADGWWLRSEIIWAKKAPMPESVTDRPTKAHEQVFLLSKQANYYYDAEAIAEPAINEGRTFPLSEKSMSKGQATGMGVIPSGNATKDTYTVPSGRNKRSVWTLGPESYAGAHFATMPTKLVEPCILAGTSAHGCCAACGAPWERVVERSDGKYTDQDDGSYAPPGQVPHSRQKINPDNRHEWGYYRQAQTTGWAATCTCNAAIVPCTVLDPFAGSGTTLAVALKHGRNAIGIELNESYIDLIHARIERSQPMLLEVT